MKRSINMLSSLLLVAIVADKAIAGIIADSIYACSGESVLLFRNVSNTVSGTDTFLYKNSKLIETWSRSKAEREEERVSYDDYGNIWMSSINISDDATYQVVQTRDHRQYNVLYEVRLIVLVAPEKSCRPQLKREGNTLIASLETGAACGNSEAIAFWLDYPFKSLESQAEANLLPGRETGTYYACIDTPALRCAGRFKPVDFCSSLTIDESNYYIMTAVSTISVVGCCLLLMTIVASFDLIQRIKKQRQSNSSSHIQDGMIEQPLLFNPTV